MNDTFGRIARRVSHIAGSAPAFLVALTLVLGWAVSGPLFGYSETWQLVINTSTTIVTFLMVFLIQNSQNHDAVAMQIKLDELIRALNGAHNSLIDIEDATEEEMRARAVELRRLANQVADAADTRAARSRDASSDPS